MAGFTSPSKSSRLTGSRTRQLGSAALRQTLLGEGTAQGLGDADVGWIGYRRPAGPTPLVGADDLAIASDRDHRGGGVDTDEAARAAQADGLLLGVDANVILPAQLHPMPQPGRRHRYRQQRHRCLDRRQRFVGALAEGAHHPVVCLRQPAVELDVEICQRRERAARHKRGLEVSVVAFGHAFEFWIPGRGKLDPSRQRPREEGGGHSDETDAADGGLAVSNQGLRHHPETVDQLPDTRENVASLAGGIHRRRQEAGEPESHH